MKLIVYIALMFVSFQLFGQDWKDSLAAARKSYDQKEYGKALEYYKSAQKNAPEGIDLSKEMGQSAYKNLQFQEAEDIYRQYASSEKNPAEKAKAYHNLGNALMQQKKYDEAIDAYKSSLRQNPSNDKTRHNLTEAMRLKKEQAQQQQEKKDNQDSQQDQKDNQQDQNSNQQNQQNQQNKSDQKQDGQQSNQTGSNSNASSKLQDKAVEKKLDDLMKQESETKRRMTGNKPSRGYSKTGKDW